MYKVESKWPHQNSIKVEWNLGKRCNLDCGYCPAEIHDNFSPHTNIKVLLEDIESSLTKIYYFSPFIKSLQIISINRFVIKIQQVVVLVKILKKLPLAFVYTWDPMIPQVLVSVYLHQAENF